MTPSRLILSAAVVCFAVAASSAQSVHTWVGPAGNDTTGTGTTAKPYATFQIAANNTAAGGIISVLGPGDYGPLTISNALTIDGTGGGSIAFSGGEGIYVNAPATATVVLRNLTIDGAGVGVDAMFGQQFLNLIIDGCRLEGFTDIGVGISSSSAENLIIRNTTIVGGELGVRVFQGTGPDQVSLDHVMIQGAIGSVAAALFTRSGKVAISDSVFTQSTVGVEADTNATISADRLVLSYNTNAVCVYSGSTAQLNNSDYFNNTNNIEACGGTVTGSESSALPPLKTSAPAAGPSAPTTVPASPGTGKL